MGDSEGSVVVTLEMAWPHCEQNAVAGEISFPHFEQYTESPPHTRGLWIPQLRKSYLASRCRSIAAGIAAFHSFYAS